MELKQVLEFLKDYRSGRFVTVAWNRAMGKNDLRASTIKAGTKVRKVVKMTLRLDINYYHTKTMREKLAELAARGEEYTPTKEAWFVRTENAGIVAHKNDPERLYLEIFPMDKEAPTIECYYIVNGEVKTSEEMKQTDLCVPSYWTKEKTGVATVKLADLTEIKYKPAH